MDMKTNAKVTKRAWSRNGMLLGAVSLVTLGLGACGDLDWLREVGKGNGSGTPVPDGGTPVPGSGTPVPDGGTSGGGADAGACVSGKLDHTVTCEDSPSGKDQAWAACKALGLALNDFGPAQCAAGDVLSIWYTCCPEGTPPSTRVPPPESCINQIEGSPTTCKTDPFAGPPIDGPSRYAQYKCCLSPTNCGVLQSGGLDQCKDLAAFEADAKITCDGKGGTVSGLGLYGACTP